MGIKSELKEPKPKESIYTLDGLRIKLSAAKGSELPGFEHDIIEAMLCCANEIKNIKKEISAPILQSWPGGELDKCAHTIRFKPIDPEIYNQKTSNLNPKRSEVIFLTDGGWVRVDGLKIVHSVDIAFNPYRQNYYLTRKGVLIVDDFSALTPRHRRATLEEIELYEKNNEPLNPNEEV